MKTKINLLLEFEKRYRGDSHDTMAICANIAKTFNLDVEKVADFIYINRYQNEESLSDVMEDEE